MPLIDKVKKFLGIGSCNIYKKYNLVDKSWLVPHNIIPVGAKKPRSVLIDDQQIDLYSVSETKDRVTLIAYYDQNSMDIFYKWCKQIFESDPKESYYKKDIVITFLLNNGTFKNVYLRGCFPVSMLNIEDYFDKGPMIEIELSYDFSG